MDHLKQLDDVLGFIGDGDRPSISTMDINAEFHYISEIHRKLILDKLQKDGFIEEIEVKGTLPDYSITYDGLFFLSLKGYKQQIKDIRTKRNHQILISWIVALGTGFAGLYALWMFCKGFLNLFDLCSCY